MTLLNKRQRELLAEGNYAAARAMAEADRPRKPRKAIRSRKRRTAEEVRAKFEREYGSQNRVDWVNELPCLACGRSPSDNAHTENEGKSRKGHHTTIVPLCRPHHRESHRGVQTFEAKHALRLCGRTLRSWAETIAHAWRLHAGEVVE
jgi:hypothetical protein